MTDLLLPEQGACPWLPASDVTALVTLNEYDIPLVGLIDQGGTTYLYACLFGEMEDTNVWAYSRLEEAEIGSLTSLLGDALADAIRSALENRMLIVAIAFDNELADWLRIDAGEEGPLVVAKRFVAQMRAHVATLQKGVEELESQQELASA